MAVRGQGMKPLDPIEDFNKPTIVPDSPAAENLEEQAAAFADAVATPASEREPVQQELPEVGAPDVPLLIRNNQMYVDFVEAILTRDKDDAPLLKMKFSFMLSPEHEELLPAEVVNAWKIVQQGHCKRYDIIEVSGQTISVNLVPDDEVVDLKIVNAVIEKPILQVIEETGSGKTKAGIRFSFLAVTERGKNPTEFAILHDGEGVWIAMQRTQGSLLDE